MLNLLPNKQICYSKIAYQAYLLLGLCFLLLSSNSYATGWDSLQVNTKAERTQQTKFFVAKNAKITNANQIHIATNTQEDKKKQSSLYVVKGTKISNIHQVSSQVNFIESKDKKLNSVPESLAAQQTFTKNPTTKNQQPKTNSQKRKTNNQKLSTNNQQSSTKFKATPPVGQTVLGSGNQQIVGVTTVDVNIKNIVLNYDIRTTQIFNYTGVTILGAHFLTPKKIAKTHTTRPPPTV